MHPIVGPLDLYFEGSRLMSDPTLSFLLYTAEPGSPTSDALRLLGTIAATEASESADQHTTEKTV